MEGTIGEIRLFAATFAPRTWAFCAGQTIAIAQNTALFSILGTTYGGNGQTTFQLPDLRGRTAIGVGSGAGLPSHSLGEMGGSHDVTLNVLQLPAHNHVAVVGASSNAPTGNDPTSAALASGTRAVPMPNIFSTPPASVPMGAGSVVVGNAGGGQSHSNMQPYLGMNYVICLYGIFPSRN